MSNRNPKNVKKLDARRAAKKARLRIPYSPPSVPVALPWHRMRPRPPELGVKAEPPRNMRFAAFDAIFGGVLARVLHQSTRRLWR
jgi:hypothetical protein